MKHISTKIAKKIGDKIGIDWNKISLEQFHMGINVEMEHGSKLDNPMTNVTGDNLIKTGEIALAHLLELSDYYTRLKKVEKESYKRIGKLIDQIVLENIRSLTRK
jgi:hypothetical protein